MPKTLRILFEHGLKIQHHVYNTKFQSPIGLFLRNVDLSDDEACMEVPSTVKLLLQHGVDPNAGHVMLPLFVILDSLKRTRVASPAALVDTIRILLDHGANPREIHLGAEKDMSPLQFVENLTPRELEDHPYFRNIIHMFSSRTFPTPAKRGRPNMFNSNSNTKRKSLRV